MSAQRMRAWQLPVGCASADQLELVEVAKPVPAADEVLLRVRANSLNYRDQMISKGRYFGGPIGTAGTPLSDGVGVIEAVGPGVKGFAPGDRVAGTFFQGWQDGPPTPAPGNALGAPPAKGMLAIRTAPSALRRRRRLDCSFVLHTKSVMIDGLVSSKEGSTHGRA